MAGYLRLQGLGFRVLGCAWPGWAAPEGPTSWGLAGLGASQRPYQTAAAAKTFRSCNTSLCSRCNTRTSQRRPTRQHATRSSTAMGASQRERERERERERGREREGLHLSQPHRPMQVLPRHPLAGPKRDLSETVLNYAIETRADVKSEDRR